MITLQLLENIDILHGEVWCRPLQIVSMNGGHSDNYSFGAGYRPENNAKWVKAKFVIGPVWYHRPIGTYREAMAEHGYDYEFMIGDIPKSHQLDMSKYSCRPLSDLIRETT